MYLREVVWAQVETVLRWNSTWATHYVITKPKRRKNINIIFIKRVASKLGLSWKFRHF